MSKYKFEEYNKHTLDYKMIITKDGHTMFPEDIVRELKQIEQLQEENKKFQKENNVLQIYKKLSQIQYSDGSSSEDLMCCGNCKHYDFVIDGDRPFCQHDENKGYGYCHGDCCPNWTHDNKTHRDRLIK